MTHHKLVTRRLLLAGAGACAGLAAGLAKARPLDLELSTGFGDGTLSYRGAKVFADKANELAQGAFAIEIETGPGQPVLGKNASASPISHYYAPAEGRSEPVCRLSAVPMLTTSFDEAQLLLSIARKDYDVAIARHGQVLLAAHPWRPGALWSKHPIEDVARFQGASVGLVTIALEEKWGTMLERLGARSNSATPDFMLSAGAGSTAGGFEGRFPYLIEIFCAVPLNFISMNRKSLEELPPAAREAVMTAGRFSEAQEWQSTRATVAAQHRELSSRGLTVVSDPPKALMDALRAAAAPDTEAWARDVGVAGTEILQQYRKAVQR